MPFAMAWGWMAMGVVAITIINRVVQTLVMSVQAPLALSLIQMVMTIIFIPLVVLIAQFIFGIGRPTLGQVDSRGQRL
jgi:rod shape-determining protein MreD